MIAIPKEYTYLNDAVGPRVLLEAMKHYGVQEVVGSRHNPAILGWAKELGLDGFYKADETPWCGLFMALCLKHAQLKPPEGLDALRALKYAERFYPVSTPMLGDILVFIRNGGGHVGLYVGEDTNHYHVLGGNQKNGVFIVPIEKGRMRAARRTFAGTAPYIRRVHLGPSGEASINEA